MTRSGWVQDPQEPSGWKWLEDLAASPSVEALTVMPVVPTGGERVSYGNAVDHRRVEYLTSPVGDVGDHNDSAAPDPSPDEITDPAHPDFVEPHRGAQPVRPL